MSAYNACVLQTRIFYGIKLRAKHAYKVPAYYPGRNTNESHGRFVNEM